MNAITKFRLCTLSNEELLAKVDEMTDWMFETQEVPTRQIPANVDGDYDLLIGEMVLRFSELVAANRFNNTNGMVANKDNEIPRIDFLMEELNSLSDGVHKLQDGTKVIFITGELDKDVVLSANKRAARVEFTPVVSPHALPKDDGGDRDEHEMPDGYID
jgi:hypothetical protein